MDFLELLREGQNEFSNIIVNKLIVKKQMHQGEDNKFILIKNLR